MPANKLNGGGSEVNGRCLQALLERLRDAVAFVDRSGAILLTNRVEELSAPPPSVHMAELGETLQIFHPDGQPYQTTEWPVLRAARTGEVILDEEFFRLLPDGSRRSFSCDCAPFYDDQGRISGAVLVARDVTEQERAQQHLAYLLPLLHYTEDAVVACDAEWHVTMWNRGAERLFGWTAAEALGRPATFLLLEESDEQRQERRRQLSESSGWRGQRVAGRKDGSLVPIEATGVTIRDPRGEITGYFGIHRDITERKRADEQLRYHASLLDNVEDGLIATDAQDFRITAWNKGAERLYGFPAEEVLGRPARDVASYPGDQSRLKLERELLETGRARIEFAARRKDGSAIEVELIAVAVKDERGETSGYLGIHRDITEQKRAAEQLAYHARLLENLDDAVLGTDTEFVLTAWNRGAEKMFGWTAAEALGQKVYELIGNDWTDAELASRLRRLAEGHKARTAGTWYGKGGNPVVAESLTIALRSEDDQVTGYLAIMRDTSELQRSELELEHRLRQQAAVAEFGLKALGDGRLQPLIDAAVTLVCRTLEVEYAKVDEPVPDRDELLVRAGAGWGEGIFGSYRMPAGRFSSPAGYALAMGGPVIVDNVATETRFEIPGLLREHRVVSDITVVIDPGDNPFGTLAALSTRPRAFSDHDVGFVQSIANVIAAAADRARADERIEAAREAERTRIARDLHDEALRELSDGLALATMGRSGSAGEDDERQWGTVISTLQRAAQQLRGAIYDLSLRGDDDRPLGDLLSELVALQNDLPGDCRIQLHGRKALGAVSLRHPGTEMLRIVTEALTNARRHAGAATITVDVGASTADVLRLQVRDDGAWPDREAAVRTRAGTGIASMFHRADALGAKLRIEARPGGGTTVSLELSLATPRPHG